MTLKPQESRDNQAGPLHKKKPGRVPNGLSLEPCKNNYHHHQSSDQENNPRVAHTQGKKKKKHLNKKHKMVSLADWISLSHCSKSTTSFMSCEIYWESLFDVPQCPSVSKRGYILQVFSTVPTITSSSSVMLRKVIWRCSALFLSLSCSLCFNALSLWVLYQICSQGTCKTIVLLTQASLGGGRLHLVVQWTGSEGGMDGDVCQKNGAVSFFFNFSVKMCIQACFKVLWISLALCCCCL